MASKTLFSLDCAGDLSKEAFFLHVVLRDRRMRACCSLRFARKGVPVKKTVARGHTCLRDRHAKARVMGVCVDDR